MVRIVCEQCKELGYLQVLGNYCRIRHYDKIIDGKSTFHYHQVSKAYAEKCLSEIKAKTVSDSKTEYLANSQPSGQELTIEHLTTNVDLKLKDNSLILETVAGEVGFEPTTPNLGGWCSIRDSYENTQHP